MNYQAELENTRKIMDDDLNQTGNDLTAIRHILNAVYYTLYWLGRAWLKI